MALNRRAIANIGSLSITHIWAALAAILTLSCQHPPSSPTLFRSLDPQHTGISFKNNLKETEEFNLIDYLYFYNGGGVAIGDINNDGLPDIYFSSNQGDNKLYLNLGNMQFEDITQSAGLASKGPWKTGVSMADVNGDGLLDIYVCRVSGYKGLEGKNELYINNGDLTFSEQAGKYGLDFSGFSTQAVFFDYDGDGDLDMYLLNHAVHTERSYGTAALRHQDDARAGDRLFRNNVDKGQTKFTSVTRQSGLFSSHIGYGLGIGIADFNHDGWPDIYVSNDFNENDYLYINKGDGTFSEESNEKMGHSSRFSMGNDLADFNNDGWVDILTLDMHPEDEKVLKRSAGEDAYEIYDLKLRFGFGRQVAQNTLQLNNGDGTFSDIAQLAGVYATDWSWSGLFADFDLDGYKDIFISNGIKKRPNDMDYINFITNRDLEGGLVKNPELSDLVLIHHMPDGAVPDYFFKNNGDLTFSNVSEEWRGNLPTMVNGAAYADLDNDGDLDLILNALNQPAIILQNQQQEILGDHPKAFLKVNFTGSANNLFGIGAKVLAFSGGEIFHQENFTARGFQSSVAPQVHLGLGNIKFLDSLMILWPSGKREVLQEVATSQTLEVRESDAVFSAANPFLLTETQPLFLLDSQNLKIDFSHIENEFNDFNQEFLIPHKISREGPKMAFDFSTEDNFGALFLPGASGQPSEIYEINAGKSKKLSLPDMATDSAYEDVHGVFIYRLGEGQKDLVVVSAGNERQTKGAQVRLYQNEGQNIYSRLETVLPDLEIQAALVIAGDFNQNGLDDLFIGGRSIPGQYGKNPKSTLLINNGKGQFEDKTVVLAPGLEHSGMVTDAQWVDLNLDGWLDLVIVGEWMPVSIWINHQGKLVNETASFGLENTEGWWNSLTVEDINNDGFPDLVAGNLGLNHKLHLPVSLYISDFDENGKLDPILTYQRDGKEFPVATRDELIKQIPALKKILPDHQRFGGLEIQDLFGKPTLMKADKKQAVEFRSKVFLNQKGKSMKGIALPLKAQFFPVQAIITHDFNHDGHMDLLLGGNRHHAAPYYGPYDAGKGLILLGNGKGDFNPMDNKLSGLSITGDIKDMLLYDQGGQTFLLITRNDEKLLVFKMGNQGLISEEAP